MKIQLITQKIKYHYKKYLAIFFICLSIALLTAEAILSIITMATSGGYPGIGSFSFVWNFIVLMVCYVMIFKGNREGSGLAFQGVLSFVFLILFLLIINASLNGLLNISSLIAKGRLDLSIYSILFAVFSLAEIVSGVFSYIRLRQYMLGRYTSTSGIKIWYLIFLGCIILSSSFSISVAFISSSASEYASVFASLLDSLSQLSCAIACIFTIMRISD